MPPDDRDDPTTAEGYHYAHRHLLRGTDFVQKSMEEGGHMRWLFDKDKVIQPGFPASSGQAAGSYGSQLALTDQSRVSEQKDE